MNGEEAIRLIQAHMIAHNIGVYPHIRLAKALDMAISALRAQQEVESKLKVVESNEPLTLDELRKMDGEPVWVQSPGIPEYGRWAIVEGAGENCLFLHDDFTCHDYGKSWLAYRQKPEED